MEKQKKIIVVKVGGKAAAQIEAMKDLVTEMSAMNDEAGFILIHGGGAEVSRVTKIFGLEPVFEKGKRMTSPEEMDIVDMVLAGKMNKSIVRLFHTMGVDAVGLSGSDGAMFTGVSIQGDAPGATRTGRITAVRTEILHHMIAGGYVPVVASTSMDRAGGGLNINADEAAFELAAALPASVLVFLSDIPGVLKDGSVIRELSKDGISAEIGNGTISGGMIPKVESSLDAIGKGVESVVIGEYRGSGDLRNLLSGEIGTKIRA